MKINEIRNYVALGDTYRLPPLTPRYLSFGCWPGSDALVERVNAWSRPYIIAYFGNVDRADRYLRQRIALWACWAHPTMLDEYSFGLTALMLPETLVDDSFSKPEILASPAKAEALAEQFLNIFAGQPATPKFPAGWFLADALALALPLMPPAVAERFLQSQRDFVVSCLDEARRRRDDTDHGFANLTDYLRFRRTNLGGYVITTQLEIGLGLDMSHALAANASLAYACDTVIDHIVFANDLFSFPKEHRTGESINYVWTLMRDGASLQLAIDTVCALLFDAEQRFVETRDSILSDPHSQHPDLARYLEGLGYIMSGTLRFHCESARYHADSFVGNAMLGGIYTFAPRPSVHTEAPAIAE